MSELSCDTPFIGQIETHDLVRNPLLTCFPQNKANGSQLQVCPLMTTEEAAQQPEQCPGGMSVGNHPKRKT
jgi:hypothetical protein